MSDDGLPDLLATARAVGADFADRWLATLPLTFALLSQTNTSRTIRWHGGRPGSPDDKSGWNGADWSNAMQAEAGEAGNVVEKLRRTETDLVGKLDRPRKELMPMLADEIADVIIYADLLATYYEIDLAAAVAHKFNKVSEIQGFPERLPEKE